MIVEIDLNKLNPSARRMYELMEKYGVLTVPAFDQQANELVKAGLAVKRRAGNGQMRVGFAKDFPKEELEEGYGLDDFLI